MPRIILDLPELPLEHPDADDAESAARQVRLAAALFWFERGVISGGKAAEIAGITRHEFMEVTARYKIQNVDFDPEEVTGWRDSEGAEGA